MRHDAWRRDAASYPLHGELATRYTDVDMWQHMNNTSLISLHGEAVRHALAGVFGPQAWRDSEPVLASTGSATDFVAESYYPGTLDWGTRLVGVDPAGLRIASALFQRGKCTGVHETRFVGWADGVPAGFSAEQVAALRAAQVPGAETLVAGAVAAPAVEALSPDDFPWGRRVDLRLGDKDARRLASDTWLARCAEQFRIAFLNHVYATSARMRGGMMVAHVALHWRRRVTPPWEWRVAGGIAHAGERSVTVRAVMFDGGQCVGSADSVMVVIDRESHRSTTLPDEVRAQLEPYLVTPGKAAPTF